MHVCLDFDGVLHDAAHPVPYRRMGPPIEGALDAVNRLHRRGCKLSVHSSRVQHDDQRKHVLDWLAWYGFPVMPVFVTKPMADVYLDDKGIRFTGWDDCLFALANLAPDGSLRRV